MKYQKKILYSLVILLTAFISACGGGGGSTPAPAAPVTPAPSNPELYIGYYTESPIADTNNPTPGVLYMYLPDTDTSFSGEFFFSYVGCLGSFDAGLLSGSKTGNAFSGTWSGDIDNNLSTGTFTSTASSSTSYTGTWTRDGGSEDFIFVGPCAYTIAGNGDFTIFKVANGTFSMGVNLDSPFSPVFSFNLSASASAVKLNVFDKVCLTNGGGVSSCAMWEYASFDTGSGLPTSVTYGVGSTISPQALVSGNTYLVTVFSYDGSGDVLDFANSEFLIP